MTFENLCPLKELTLKGMTFTEEIDEMPEGGEKAHTKTAYVAGSQKNLTS